jgi:uncharacterized repeat protein (TIGR03803 family)
VLYEFTGGTDGSNPYGGVIIGKNDVLYGTTQGGGINERGTVFSLTPPGKGQTTWTETVLHYFTGSDGFAPLNGQLVADDRGTLYGTTIYGGYYGHGVVFRRLGAVLRKTIFDIYAAMPSSWNAPRMAVRSAS